MSPRYIALLAGMGLPPGLPEVIVDADACAADGWLLDRSCGFSALIGRSMPALREAVKAALA